MKKVFAGENCGREAAVYLGRAGKNRYFGWTGPLQKNAKALLGRAAFAAYERFAGGKTSAEGWLCHPEHLNHRRAERALGPRSPKRKTRYKRVFLFGKALQSRYFKFSIRHLDILPNGPSGPRRFLRRTSVLPEAKPRRRDGFAIPSILNHRRAERALGPRSPKRKTRYKRVFLFGGGGESRTPVRKPFHGNFSGRRRLLRESCSPCSRHPGQAVTPRGLVSFIIHGRRKALPAHVHH